ncbi:DNA translocase FtsK [Sporosarcina sp. resist]|uniref:DNA translocase FtsK n=1 Tax=Sporosarcina sp. resist TaxID=2762563 RepID=UPI00164D791E|nr:DNA translocase FtsK [Sporosarcina sp. resist]QNK89693.1 DNA translocase FtsK [Sporosarcina sp. resist]
MKRVIVLSWFKTIVDRLFGPDEDNNKVETEYEKTENEIDESLNKNETSNNTSFRFPIISDAEIYGWDDESVTEVDYPKYTTKNKDADDNYETKPLSENAKWPSDNRTVNIFRADSLQKYGVKEKEKRSSFSSTKKALQEELPPKVNVTVQKRSSKPFTPTAVPSPVHGFINPRREVTTPLKTEEVKLQPPEEEVVVTESQLTKTDEFYYENEKTSSIPILNEDFVIGNDSRELTSSEIEPLKVEVYETETTVTEDEETVVLPDAIELSKDEFATIESLVIEEDFKGIISDEVDYTKDALPDVEAEVKVEPSPGIPELVEQQSQVTKKERTVPFNVLMLKSDKEKLKVVEPLSVKVPNESKKVTISEPISTKPLVDIREEVLVETKEIAGETLEEEEPYYAFPSLDYLIPPESQIEDTEWLESQSEKLEEALSHFAVKATVIEAMQGPTVTRFELTVGVGTKVSKVRNLTDDLKLALAAEDIRIQAPIPGRSSIGIEIPNRKTRPVRISEVIATEQFRASTSPLEAVLGLSLTGTPVTLDLRKMPHGMIAGATGSGKSVCINSILVSLLYKATPTDLKMMLIDPKMVELAPFNGIPHLISPVITDVKAATAALKWAVAEMERRYELLAHAGVRDIERYNKAVVESRRFSLKMPYLLIVIDELADLMMMAPADVEVSISRIAQKARACGIHLIIATQRPSVDVITGTIKANIPTRIAFSVSSQIDSRTIIDSPGAERLLGKGDMLYIGNGQSSGVRLQGTFVTDEEIERIIEHVRNEATPDYLFGQEDLLASSIEEEGADPLFEEACLFIHETGSASTSLLQRNFSIGYNRAAKLMDRMEKSGFISGPRGSKARDVFLTESDLDRLTDRIE